MQRIGYFTVFLLPAVALYGFMQRGAWAWAFVPVLAGLAATEAISYLWKRKLIAPRGRP